MEPSYLLAVLRPAQTEWQREKQLWARAHELCNRLGIKPKSEDLEDFVANHSPLSSIECKQEEALV